MAGRPPAPTSASTSLTARRSDATGTIQTDSAARQVDGGWWIISGVSSAELMPPAPGETSDPGQRAPVALVTSEWSLAFRRLKLRSTARYPERCSRCHSRWAVRVEQPVSVARSCRRKQPVEMPARLPSLAGGFTIATTPRFRPAKVASAQAAGWQRERTVFLLEARKIASRDKDGVDDL